ncbi:MAG: RIP metalloprotease RseP [Alphaproteobacteria bacterium]|nr:RIP metalloprotease RseP [Alphaproteobacteria bacterium]
MNFIEVFQMLGGNLWFYGGAFILVLSILVFVHEWGHYIVARLCGVGVETFSIGFGKELFGVNDRNGTRWKVSLVPLGGYVKLYGDMDPASAGHSETVAEEGVEPARPMTPEERKKAFFSQPAWKRAAIVVAGPAINYLFAILILSFLFTFNGQPITPPSAAAIIGGSSADRHGFLPHDKIISIDGKKIGTFEDIRREMMIGLDTQKRFVLERNGETLEILASPERLVREDRFGFKQSFGVLGLISPRHAVNIETITHIDGTAYNDAQSVRKALLERMGETFTLAIKLPNGESDALTVKPVSQYNESLADPEAAGPQILYLSDVDANIFVKYPFIKSVGAATKECWVITRGTVEALWQMIVGTRSASELGGVIRIGALAGDMAKQGIIALVLFTALLSINLGLINLFPIPMLDGGHLVFYAFETVLRRPVPERIQEYAFRIGLAFLVGIMVFANLSDIVQLLT